MVEKNQEIQITIHGYTSDGAGVGIYNGMAVFVSGTIIGETVRALVIKVCSKYAVAKLLSVIQPSPLRQISPCKWYGKCGGCSFMHMEYEAELSQKQRRVKDAFERIGGIGNAEIMDIIPSPEPLFYRNKAQFPAGIYNGVQVFGFYAARSHTVIPITDCMLLPSEIRTIHKAAQKWLSESGVPVYDESTATGAVRHLFVRKGRHSGQIQVCLVSAQQKIEQIDGFVKELRDACSTISSVVLNINDRKTNVIFGDTDILLWGDSTISDEMCGRRFLLSTHSFYQVNTLQAENLYRIAAEWACEAGGKQELLLDLYCGAGTIGLTMAEKFKHVIGLEIVPQAVENARTNARANGVKNADFICADAGAAGPLIKELGIPDVLVVDPPRKGCDISLLETVTEISPKKIIYISCDPATAARDISFLTGHGYDLKRVQPADMFPRTAHVECVCLLSRY